jgi:hypothetical protein
MSNLVAKGPSTYDVMVKIDFLTPPLCHGFAFEISQKFNGASQVADPPSDHDIICGWPLISFIDFLA